MHRMPLSASMMFLGVAIACAPLSRAATVDTFTQGNWVGVYGGQGYILNAYDLVPTNSGAAGVYQAAALPLFDRKSLPAYVTDYTYSPGAQQYVWNSNQFDSRDIQDPAGLGAPRNAATTFNGANYSVTLNVNRPAHFKLSVYALDWDNNGRDTTFAVGADSVRVNNTLIPSGYFNGVWMSYDVNVPSAGPVVLDIVHNPGNPTNSVISAIAFDAVPEPSALCLLAAGALLAGRRRARA